MTFGITKEGKTSYSYDCIVFKSGFKTTLNIEASELNVVLVLFWLLVGHTHTLSHSLALSHTLSHTLSLSPRQWACHHMWSLLDADQDIPWVDQPLVFHHKWRFWTQPYNASFHTPVHYGSDTDMTIGSPYEYDVPECAHGVPGCEMVNDNWIHTITGNRIGNHHLVSLNFHCHAPTCLSMAVYACDKSVALKDCNATVGQLLCQQMPVYGGTGAKGINGTKFDEPGYIAIPDCLWGGKEFGLEPPVNLTGVPLHMVKKTNGTYNGKAQGHYGEMAGGQPWVY